MQPVYTGCGLFRGEPGQGWGLYIYGFSPLMRIEKTLQLFLRLNKAVLSLRKNYFFYFFYEKMPFFLSEKAVLSPKTEKCLVITLSGLLTINEKSLQLWGVPRKLHGAIGCGTPYLRNEMMKDT